MPVESVLRHTSRTRFILTGRIRASARYLSSLTRIFARRHRDVGLFVSIDRGNIADSRIFPFFFLKFERNPLDGRADSALTVRMRYMEIVYHKGYIEAVYKFLKPPASQLESVEALLVRGAFRHAGAELNFTLGRGESNTGKFAEGNENRVGIRSADAQDCRRADGFECTHHHRTRGVSNLVSGTAPMRS